jgi:hypothetical protein
MLYQHQLTQQGGILGACMSVAKHASTPAAAAAAAAAASTAEKDEGAGRL